MKLICRLIICFALFAQLSCNFGAAQQEGNKPVTAISGLLLSIKIELPANPYSEPQQRQRFVHQAISRIKALPVVESAAAASAPVDYPVYWKGSTKEFPNDSHSVHYNAVTPEYFRVHKLELLRGRLFEERDSALDSRLLIISESAARKLFQDRDPLGKDLSITAPFATVIGVVSDVHDSTGTPRAQAYGLYDADPETVCSSPECVYIVVRTKSQSETVTEKLKEEIMSVDKKVAISDVKSL